VLCRHLHQVAREWVDDYQRERSDVPVKVGV
jgi:hypothetical protein